jgi:hypothetical protein
MMESWQTPVALAVVAIAAFFLIRMVVRKRRNPGCGSGCCPTDTFKARLMR